MTMQSDTTVQTTKPVTAARIMRTQAEIATRCEGAKSDMFGFALGVLVNYLDFEHARPFLKPEATADDWRAAGCPKSPDAIEPDLREYMEFAWGKALDHRGLSASRSIDKLAEWIWLMCRDDVSAAFELAEYPQYGVPKLHIACTMLGLPIPDNDAIKRMAEGESCEPGCRNGCGS